jgi:hypothetical protein
VDRGCASKIFESHQTKAKTQEWHLVCLSLHLKIQVYSFYPEESLSENSLSWVNWPPDYLWDNQFSSVYGLLSHWSLTPKVNESDCYYPQYLLWQTWL